MVGGIELSGISTRVVTPPEAAARVPVQKPSQSVRPGSFRWTCALERWTAERQRPWSAGGRTIHSLDKSWENVLVFRIYPVGISDLREAAAGAEPIQDVHDLASGDIRYHSCGTGLSVAEHDMAAGEDALVCHSKGLQGTGVR